MIYGALILTLMSFKHLQATLFDLSLIDIDDESENLNGFPNITTIKSWSRPIGATPGSIEAAMETDANAQVPTVVPIIKRSTYYASETPKPAFEPTTQILFPNSIIFNLGPPMPIPSVQASAAASSLPAIGSVLNSFPFPDTGFAPIVSGLSQSSTDDTFIRAPKRAKIDLEIETYIHTEVQSYGFYKAEKSEVLRKALEFIACNDYKGYCDFEPVFQATLKHRYHLFKKGKNRADYMMHYIIRFGATNFLNSPPYELRISSIYSNIVEAFEYLIATKSLEVVLMFIQKARHLNDGAVMMAISRAVQIRYPDLHFLDYFVFELKFFGNRCSNFDNALNIYKSVNEKDKFYHLTKYLETAKTGISEPHFNQIRLMEIPIKYEEYFMSLDIHLKCYFARIMIINGNMEKLIRIVGMVPEIVLHSCDGNIFTWAVMYDKPNIVQFLMEIAPEMAVLGSGVSLSPVAIAISRSNLNVLRVFAASGFNFLQELQFKKTTNTALQYAFENKLDIPFEFITDFIGGKNALSHLLELYGSKNEIMQRAMLPRPNIELIAILRCRLGFDLGAEYNYKGKTGNILIFFEKENYINGILKMKFGL